MGSWKPSAVLCAGMIASIGCVQELGALNLDGEVDHLPPTLSVQYHFPVDAQWKAYVGVGVNWTMFSNAKVDAPVSVDVDDSVGPAAQVASTSATSSE